MTAADRHVVRILPADERGDGRAPVGALCAVPVVAEAGHQADPGPGDPLDAPAVAGRSVAEAVAGQRRADDVERVPRVAAVRHRVGERADRLEELYDRSRPAMGEDERQRVVVGRADVQEVDPEAVDRGTELRQGVQAPLGGPPVVLLGPVPAQRAQVAQGDALRPVVGGLLIRPSRAPQAFPQVGQCGLGDVEAERDHFLGHAVLLAGAFGGSWASS
jgi:hypothetical protein